jgi:hypothetical protein
VSTSEDADPWTEENRPAAEALVGEVEDAGLFHPGAGHLFADASVGDYDEGAAALLMRRTPFFLRRFGS